MKKIKTIEAVAAYKTLKALKTSSMSDDAAMRVWKESRRSGRGKNFEASIRKGFPGNLVALLLPFLLSTPLL